MDVEYIQPKLMEPLPDLAVRLLEPFIHEDCNAEGVCEGEVFYEMFNLGPVDPSGLFKIRVEATNYLVQEFLTEYNPLIPLSTPIGVALQSCFAPNCVIKVTVDADNAIEESDETNNTTSQNIPVKVLSQPGKTCFQVRLPTNFEANQDDGSGRLRA